MAKQPDSYKAVDWALREQIKKLVRQYGDIMRERQMPLFDLHEPGKWTTDFTWTAAAPRPVMVWSEWK